MRVELVGITKSDSIVLGKLPVLIGQDSETDIQLGDPTVGRYHCLIQRIDDHVMVWDLGTGEGTFVNDAQVNKAYLEPGDKLRLGRTDFLVNYEHSTRRSLIGV
jgi:pSer/pThr/pTyr-binding forkhead associated (FHA) protein